MLVLIIFTLLNLVIGSDGNQEAILYPPPPPTDKSNKAYLAYSEVCKRAFQDWSLAYRHYWEGPDVLYLDKLINSALNDHRSIEADVHRLALKWFLYFAIQVTSLSDQGERFAQFHAVLGNPVPIPSTHKPPNRYEAIEMVIDVYSNIIFDFLPKAEFFQEHRYGQLYVEKYRAVRDHGKIHTLLTEVKKYAPFMEEVRNNLWISEKILEKSEREQIEAAVKVIRQSMSFFLQRKTIEERPTPSTPSTAALDAELDTLRIPVSMVFAEHLLGGKKSAEFLKWLGSNSGFISGHADGILLQYLQDYLKFLEGGALQAYPISVIVNQSISPEELRVLRQLEAEIVQSLESETASLEEKKRSLVNILETGEGRIFSASSKNHAMLVYVTKQDDQHFQAELINSGEGIGFHTQSNGKYAHSMILNNLTIEDLSRLNVFSLPHLISEQFYNLIMPFKTAGIVTSRHYTKGQKGGSCVLTRWFLRMEQILTPPNPFLAKQFRYYMEIRVVEEFLIPLYSRALTNVESLSILFLLKTWSQSKAEKIEELMKQEDRKSEFFAATMGTHTLRALRDHSKYNSITLEAYWQISDLLSELIPRLHGKPSYN